MRHKIRPDFKLLKLPLSRRLIVSNLADYNSTTPRIKDPDRSVDFAKTLVFILVGVSLGLLLLTLINLF